MKVIYLTAGAADMYCGTCLHDNTLAAALLAAGHDVQLTALYTPTRTDEPNVSGRRVYFSGINVYLQQKSWLFRHTPWLLDKLFESPWILRKLAARASATAPEKLGELTVSMLRGEEGRQRKELTKLIRWMADEKPDIVHLSNSLLIGVAHEIRRSLAVPVVCSLSGEDIFLEHITEPYYKQARDTLRQRNSDIDIYVAMNRYFAEFMADYLDVPHERIKVIRHGVNIEHYRDTPRTDAGLLPTIGYLARVCPDKGLHVLVAAAKELARQRGAAALSIRAAGYLSQLDRPYLDQIVRAAAQPPAIDFEYVGELDLSGKLSFLSSLNAMALPTVYRESKGISALESLALATPIIVPNHGVFPELIADTGGGVLFEPENVAALASALAEHLDSPTTAAQRGQRGQAAIHTRYTAEQMARETHELYLQIQKSAEF